MLSLRTETILRCIVGQYITKAVPVPSQSITDEYGLRVSSATIRNEMAHLEEEGYIIRPHPSAGSVPSDKGYRHYVEFLGEVKLPLVEQRLVSHLFHQVEKELDEWLHLAATLIAQRVQNVAVVTIPKPSACRLKHLEVVSLQDFLGLLILVLTGARVRQRLITFEQVMTQSELTAVARKLSAAFSGLTGSQILTKDMGLSSPEQQLTDFVLKMMSEEDKQDFEELYLDGLYLTLNQPEFIRDRRMTLTLADLVEHRNLLRNVIPWEVVSSGVRVVIGQENKAEVMHPCSVVISQYGLPEEAVGTIAVIGPTRMPYAHTLATLSYLSSVLSELVARLYGREPSSS